MKTKLKLSAVTAVAVLFVLALLQPYGIDRLEHGRFIIFTLDVSLVFLTSMASLLLAKCVFGVDLDKVGSKRALYKSLLAYHLINLPILAALLLTYHAWFYCGTVAAGWFDEGGGFTLEKYAIALCEVSVMSFFLFVLHVYMLRNTRLQQELAELKAINALLEKRQEQLAEKAGDVAQEKAEAGNGTVPDAAREGKAASAEEKRLLVGNTKSAVLEVAPADIVYIESMQNYADVCYMDGGSVMHKTLRITLKQLQETLAGASNIVSPHRAFLVNLDFVVAVAGQSTVGYHLQMFGLDKEIPVSRANIRSIKERLSGEVKN